MGWWEMMGVLAGWKSLDVWRELAGFWDILCWCVHVALVRNCRRLISSQQLQGRMLRSAPRISKRTPPCINPEDVKNPSCILTGICSA